MAKGDGAGGHNIDRGMYNPEKQAHIIAKLSTLGPTPTASDACVPKTSPCGCCARCRRRAAVRVVAEALEPGEGHEAAPWTFQETAELLMALGLKLEPKEAA